MHGSNVNAVASTYVPSIEPRRTSAVWALVAALAGFFGHWSTALAQTVISDVALDVTYDGSQPLLPGSSRTIGITVTNLGPATALNATVVTQAIPALRFRVFPIPATTPCAFVIEDLSGSPPTEIVALVYPPIPPGAAVTCTIGIAASSGASGTFSWRLFAQDVTSGNSDPIPNGLRTILLSFSPIAVDATGTLGCLCLALGLILITLRRH
jgi:hypothetical protein